MNDVFAEKSFAVTIMLLMFVPALPLPTGGATHVFEAITVLLAAQMVLGRSAIEGADAGVERLGEWQEGAALENARPVVHPRQGALVDLLSHRPLGGLHRADRIAEQALVGADRVRLRLRHVAEFARQPLVALLAAPEPDLGGDQHGARGHIHVEHGKLLIDWGTRGGRRRRRRARRAAGGRVVEASQSGSGVGQQIAVGHGPGSDRRPCASRPGCGPSRRACRRRRTPVRPDARCSERWERGWPRSRGSASAPMSA